MKRILKAIGVSGSLLVVLTACSTDGEKVQETITQIVEGESSTQPTDDPSNEANVVTEANVVEEVSDSEETSAVVEENPSESEQEVTAVSNQAPTVSAGINQTVKVNRSVTLVGTADDSDGSIVSYQWKEGTELLGQSPSLTFTSDEMGSHTLTFSATDNEGATASDSVTVTVVANQAPVANAGQDESVTVNESVTLRGTGSDTDGSIVSYLWQEGSATLGELATLSYVPTVVGNHTLSLTVTDDDGASSSDEVVVTATEVTSSANSIPTLSSSTKQSYLVAINQARSVQQNCGSEGLFAATSAVAWSDQLYNAAYEHSHDMAQTNTFDHTGSGTQYDWTGVDLGHASSMRDRIDAYGFSWWTIAENIGAGTNVDTPEEIVSNWLGSPGHCANLMNPNFTHIGLAHVYNSAATYKHYWTLDLAQSR
ncbi:MAG TPA: PKD domain-containing protein [Campylobacterales bacterium]|nr:PKD domain-containing protein [Campylobacterales bacterium]